MADRQVSILTESQRAYLRGEKEYARASERKKRQRIRDRVRAGIADMALLASSLPETDDFDLIFDDFEDWHEFQQTLDERLDSEGVPHGAAEPDGALEGRAMTRNIHGAVAFLYLAVSEYGGGIEGFEGVTATAIELAETTDEERADADVSIEIERSSRPRTILDKAEAGEELTAEDIETLVEAGESDALAHAVNRSLLEATADED